MKITFVSYSLSNIVNLVIIKKNIVNLFRLIISNATSLIMSNIVTQKKRHAVNSTSLPVLIPSKKKHSHSLSLSPSLSSQNDEKRRYSRNWHWRIARGSMGRNNPPSYSRFQNRPRYLLLLSFSTQTFFFFLKSYFSSLFSFQRFCKCQRPKMWKKEAQGSVDEHSKWNTESHSPTPTTTPQRTLSQIAQWFPTPGNHILFSSIHFVSFLFWLLFLFAEKKTSQLGFLRGGFESTLAKFQMSETLASC